jgi:hypothetical protein
MEASCGRPGGGGGPAVIYDESELRKMIKELLADDSDRLSAWECDFVDSVNRQGNLSEKQAAVIVRIYERLFP